MEIDFDSDEDNKIELSELQDAQIVIQVMVLMLHLLQASLIVGAEPLEHLVHVQLVVLLLLLVGKLHHGSKADPLEVDLLPYAVCHHLLCVHQREFRLHRMPLGVYLLHKAVHRLSGTLQNSFHSSAELLCGDECIRHLILEKVVCGLLDLMSQFSPFKKCIFRNFYFFFWNIWAK